MNNPALAPSAGAALIDDSLSRLRRLFVLRAAADAVTITTLLAAVAIVVAGARGSSDGRLIVVATMLIVAMGAVVVLWGTRFWTADRVARAIERSPGGFDNLLVTLADINRGRLRRPHPAVHEALVEQAATRLAAVNLRELPSPGAHVLRAALTLAGFAILATVQPAPATPFSRTVDRGETSVPAASGRLRVVVSPPAYLAQPPAVLIDPDAVKVIEGSRVRLEMAATERVLFSERGRAPRPVESRDGVAVHELVAHESGPLLITDRDQDWFLHLDVTPDRPPAVTIRDPGRDLVFGAPRGRVSIAIEATDDFGLASLQLRFTRVSGAGEAVTFTEGDLPVTTEQTGSGAWRARGEIALDSLQLEAGDAIVYRALARDRKPGRDPASSGSFLIEIGRLGRASTAGFSVPQERDRQGLSQQMVIVKTERLQARRGELPADALREEARGLAVEQRMVRAEFVFMTGGEVQDEVEEAEHAHELVEGRFENEGQRELLAAIREMSRAEARLNAGDLSQALVFERAALAALQRAFDRRRYLLRTLPERTQIDLSRRLSGEAGNARQAQRAAAAAVDDRHVTAIRQLLEDLDALDGADSAGHARLAARVLDVGPAVAALQQAAARLARARDSGDAVAAAREAQRVLAEELRKRLAPPAGRELARSPASGHLADRLRGTGGRP